MQRYRGKIEREFSETNHGRVGKQAVRVPLDAGAARPYQSRLKPRIYRLALQRENAKHAFMRPAKRFFADEAFKSFDA